MTANEHLADLIKKAAYISLPSNTSEEHLRIFTNCLIAHGVTVQEWIPIKDRLPEVGEYVQTIDKWGHIHDRKLYRFKDGFLCFQPDGLKPGADITHWAYPPEPPDGWERRTDGYGCYQRKPEPPKGE